MSILENAIKDGIEIEKLKAVNADLLAALEEIARSDEPSPLLSAMGPDVQSAFKACADIARAAIKTIRKGEVVIK